MEDEGLDVNALLRRADRRELGFVERSAVGEDLDRGGAAQLGSGVGGQHSAKRVGCGRGSWPLQVVAEARLKQDEQEQHGRHRGKRDDDDFECHASAIPWTASVGNRLAQAGQPDAISASISAKVRAMS